MQQHWVKYPNDVLVSRWGVVVRRVDSAWYAYPTGSGELGPFATSTEAQAAIMPAIYGIVGASSARS